MCNCIELSNEALKPQGLRLTQAFVFSRENITAKLYIDTEKLDPRDRKVKTAKIMCSYCPFCGEKIVDTAKETHV